MPDAALSVRELQHADIAAIARYWLSADPAHLTGMGVDLAKMPREDAWSAMLSEQLSKPIPEKQSYCMIWQIDGQPAGHSNINKIVFGEEAYMHLHLWEAGTRQKGVGAALVKMTLPWFFEKYALKRLYCEPYALNPAPNKTLEKVGFELEKTHTTIPGWLNFEQPVNLWVLTFDRFQQIK